MKIYKSKFRFASLPLAVLVFIQALLSTPVAAQSSGPLQPEFQQTSIVGADNLVDPFTGNFNYSIPLMEVGGFPLTLSYSSDHKMEEEASWVGFGWTLNPGAISRQVRGLPDDFRGDEVVHNMDMANSVTTTITPGADFELFGAFGLGYGMNFSYNNFTGFDLTSDLSPSFNIIKAISGNPGKDSDGKALPPTGLQKFVSKNRLSAVVGTSISSRSGMENLSFSGSAWRYFTPSTSINFGGLTYTPVGEMPKQFEAYAFTAKTGSQAFFPDASQVTLRVSSAIQRLAEKSVTRPAFGYLYLDGSQANRNALQDYNKDQGGLNIATSPRLPMPFGTPDVYSISGSALSGQLQISRNDLGIFRPTYSEANSLSTSVGLDLAPDVLLPLPGAHIGANVTGINVRSKQGGWQDLNDLAPHLLFERNQGSRENAFFQFTGEPNTQMGRDWYERFEQDLPISPRIRVAGDRMRLESNLMVQADLTTEASNFINLADGEVNYRTRRPRAQQVTYLTAQEASDASYEPMIERFRALEADDDFSDFIVNTDERVTADRRGHHISEIRVTKTGGQRFLYGLPTYNFVKREVTFNASGLATEETRTPGSSSYGLISYTPDHHDTPDNELGRDKFFDEVITPSYPASHLLTGILSPDYVDRLHDGPTVDDLGQYVSFGYSQLVNDVDNSRVGWRMPMGTNRANYSPGNLADNEDDRASFVYGEKEIFYLHHIDSKTHRAVFLTSNRDDAKPALPNGATDGSFALQKLDQIRLFTHSELQENGANAVPIKTVHFTYDSNGLISGNLPNADGGKLTLTDVHFTYADNERGADNPYTFEYKTSVLDENGDPMPVSFQSNMIDRWGNQIPDGTAPGPQAHPFSVQDTEIAQNFCAIGNLTRVGLPTGAKITVDYEPDDYAYVQDKRAGRMYEVLGFSASPTGDPTQFLYTPFLSAPPNYYVHVAVDDLPMNGSMVDQTKAKVDFLKDVDRLYFESRVSLNSSGDKEKITGFADYDPASFQAVTDGDQKKIIVKLAGLNASGDPSEGLNAMHPVTFAALEKLRLELHWLQYSLPYTGDHFSPNALLSVLTQSSNFFRSFHASNIERGNGAAISTEESEKSYVRLADGRYRKFGDGSRVRTVNLSDEWLVQTSPGQEANYTQRYIYETTTPDGQTISSGVAANEPMIGKEEMLMVDIQKSSANRPLAPNESYYTMWPVGLQFFPGPRVGYSKVRMTTELAETYAQSRPGSTEYQFYTAQDFPTLTSFTNVSSSRIQPLPRTQPFFDFYRKKLGLTQGYVVEVNDMHGKMKQTTEYDYFGASLSSSFYRYRQKSNDQVNQKNELSNYVSVSTGNSDSEESITDDYLGMDVQIWTEAMASTTRSEGGGIQANLGLESAPPFIVAAANPIPSYTNSETGLNTAVTTKLISRYGILEKVEVTNNGSSLTTNNLRWDALTGTPLLTSTENEYGQPIYNHTLPARFVDCYDGMGPAYLTEGIRYDRVFIENGELQNFNGTDPNEELYPGDELYISLDFSFVNENWKGRAHVMPGAEEGTILIAWDDGSLVNTQFGTPAPFSVIVTRSGRCNMLGATVEQTSSLIPPNEGDFWRDEETGKILQFGAQEYSETWSNMCLPSGEAPPFPGGPGDDCEDIQQIFDSRYETFTSGLSNTPRVLHYFDWIADSTELAECGLCEQVFEMYFASGLIKDLGEYGQCNGPLSPFERTNQEGIDNCAFLTEINFQYLGQNGMLSEMDICAAYNTLCDEFPCRNTIPECTNCYDQQPGLTNNPAAVSKSLTPVNCFPWSPTNATTNPYLNGRRGNWRPSASYVANQRGRSKAAANSDVTPADPDNNYAQPLLHQDGTFENFRPFWSPQGRINNNQFLLTSRAVAYDDHGHDLESEDALGVPSGAQYGFFQNLPVAIAQNAKRTDIAFESFEDYPYDRTDDLEVWERHFSVFDDQEEPSEADLTNVAAHTGLHAMKFKPEDGERANVELEYPTSGCSDGEENCQPDDPCACVHSFAPAAAQTYQLSLWVARTTSLKDGNQAATPGSDVVLEDPSRSFHVEVRAVTDGGLQPLVQVFPAGPVIEGWQRLTAKFTLPADATALRLNLNVPTVNGDGDTFYVDDMRIHPYESSMVTYAYNPYTLRLMAQMDDNGYAVFYEYDDEGQLIRQKRETERGVMTITEQHTNLAKTNGQ